jgi:hypothetical protein
MEILEVWLKNHFSLLIRYNANNPHPMTSSHGPSWRRISFRASPKYVETLWSPAIEIFVTHDHFDKDCPHPGTYGLLVNRHVTGGVALTERVEPFTRDTLGVDEKPDGANLSLASGPRSGGADQGGELYVKNDGRTRFQRDWDFLEKHVELAFERYRVSMLPLMSGEAYLRNEVELGDWRKVQALAHYARNWKTRMPRLGASSNAVDTLLYSFHCGGAAQIMFSLATVAGFKSRRITISNHSMVEVWVNGSWVWVDNLVGGDPLMPVSYVDMLENFPLWPNLGLKQLSAYAGPQMFARCPFEMDQALSWRTAGYSGERVGHGDVAEGIGLALAYNPATAEGLYPGKREHRFFCLEPDGSPTIPLKEKQGWIRASYPLRPGEALRARYTLSACDDNPVVKLKARVWVGENVEPDHLELSVDGERVPGGGTGKTPHSLDTVEFLLPDHAFTFGEHEVVLRSKTDGSASVTLYPDLIRTYLPCLQSDRDFRPCPDEVETDPIHTPTSF